MKRGEVRWYRFSRPDKRRPVLVLTRDSVLEYLSDVTVAPITSTIRDIPSEVCLDETDGMKKPCAVNLDHIKTVPKARLGGIVTTLSSEKIQRVGRALRFALDV